MDTLPFSLSDSLDVAQAKTVAWLTQQGTPPNEQVNEGWPQSNFARVLLIFPTERQVGAVLLTTMPWTQEVVQPVSALLANLYSSSLDRGDNLSYFFMSPHAVPKGLSFMFGNTMASRLERYYALKQPTLASAKPDAMREIARSIGRPLLGSLCGQVPAEIDMRFLGLVEEAILTRLRPETDRNRRMPDESPTPTRVLTALAAVCGEAIMSMPQFKATWIPSPEGPQEPALDVTLRQTGQSGWIHPCSKLRKLYKSGAEDSLVYLVNVLQQHLLTQSPALGSPAPPPA